MSGRGDTQGDEAEQLFHQEVAAVPTSTPSQGPLSPMASMAPHTHTYSGPSSPVTGQVGSGGGGPSGIGGAPPLNTLDEPVWATIKRDLKRIGANLVLVVFPFSNRDQQSAALRNWDLWGPMAFTLTLAVCLSVGNSNDLKPGKTHDQGSIFALVFGMCALGAIVLTANVILLGGNIGFFQSLCLLGYCLFPLDIAAIVSIFVTNHWIRAIVVAVCVGWASWASIPFIGGSVSPARRALAVYPLLLLYITMSWLAIIKGDVEL